MAGRPRSFDRATALTTAMEQFWRQGYEATTVAGLTEAIGITAPSLYAAFGDKDRLYAEAVRCYTDWVTGELDAAMDQPTTYTAVAALLHSTAEAHTDPATPLGCFVLTEPRLAPQREEFTRRIAARIQRGIDAGDMAAGANADQLGAFLSAVLAGMSAAARDGASAETVRAIADAALGAIPVAQAAPAP